MTYNPHCLYCPTWCRYLHTSACTKHRACLDRPLTWANGFGVWHAAVVPGPTAQRRARGAIRRELLDRDEIRSAGYRVRVELAPEFAQNRTDGRVVYREIAD